MENGDGYGWHGSMLRNVFIVMFILIAIAIFISFIGVTTGPHFGIGWSPWGFLWTFFILLCIFWIIRGVMWGSGWGHHAGHRHGYHNPKDILKERYARGEVTKKQYDEMLKDLDR